MAISLNNINISLDQFAAAASGKYNIGQLKLGEDGASISRVNNHKTLRFLNTTRIGAEESLAIRSAFANALSKSGISAESMAQIRKELGLADGEIELLTSGKLEPLSAATVRTIIDKYAGEINAQRSAEGLAAISTRADLFAGETEETRNDRATTANNINRSTLNAMNVEMHDKLEHFSVLLGPVENGEGLSIMSKQFAKDIMKAVTKNPEFLKDSRMEMTMRGLAEGTSISLSNDGTVVAKFTLPNGNDIAIDTRLNRDEFLQQLDNALAGNGKVVKPGDGGKWGEVNSKSNAPVQPNPEYEAKMAEKREKEAEIRKQHEELIASMREQYSKNPAKLADATISYIDKKLAFLKAPENASKFKSPTLEEFAKSEPGFATLPKESQKKVFDKAFGKASSERFEFFKDSIAPKVLDALNVARGRCDENVILLNRLCDFVRSSKGDIQAIKNEIREAIIGQVQQPYEDDIGKNFNINAFRASGAKVE